MIGFYLDQYAQDVTRAVDRSINYAHILASAGCTRPTNFSNTAVFYHVKSSGIL
jgi:hypothetical protein